MSTFGYIIKQDTTADKLVYDLSAVTYNKTARELSVTAKDSEDLGIITVKYNGSAIPPVNAGVYTSPEKLCGRGESV